VFHGGQERVRAVQFFCDTDSQSPGICGALVMGLLDSWMNGFLEMIPRHVGSYKPQKSKSQIPNGEIPKLGKTRVSE